MEIEYKVGMEVNLPNDKEGVILSYLDNQYYDWDDIYVIAVYGEEEVKIYTACTLDKYN